MINCPSLTEESTFRSNTFVALPQQWVAFMNVCRPSAVLLHFQGHELTFVLPREDKEERGFCWWTLVPKANTVNNLWAFTGFLLHIRASLRFHMMPFWPREKPCRCWTWVTIFWMSILSLFAMWTEHSLWLVLLKEFKPAAVEQLQRLFKLKVDLWSFTSISVSLKNVRFTVLIHTFSATPVEIMTFA